MFIFISPKPWIDVVESIKWSDFSLDTFICMKTAQGTIQPGWLASQADLLSTDWEIIK